MAFSYQNVNFLCRCTRATKLYGNATDIAPTLAAVLAEGQMFYTKQAAKSGQNTLYQISESYDGTPIPVGYWCPGQLLEMMAIEEFEEEKPTIQADMGTPVDKTFVVKASGAKVYTSRDGSKLASTDLPLNSRIYVDKVSYVLVNGVKQTRYHVSWSTTGDDSVDGGWLLENSSVSDDLKLVEEATPRLMFARVADSPFANDEEPVAAAQTFSVQSRAVEEDDASNNSNLDAGVVTVESAEDDYIKTSTDYQAITDAEVDGAYRDATLGELYEAYELTYAAATRGMSLMSIPIGRMNFVHGMPFQFNYLTDRRTGATGTYGRTTPESADAAGVSDTADCYGHTFAREIAGNMPIAVIVPGVPVYLTKAKSGLIGYAGGSNNMRNLWKPLWIDDLTSDENQSALNNLINGASGGSFDYFTIQVDMEQYFFYVNALCRNSAKLMGIGNLQVQGKNGKDYKAKSFDWGKFNTAAMQDYNTFEEVVGLSGGVSFAYDPLSSISDTINNSTGESSFVGQMQGISGKAKELQFLLGEAGFSETIDMSQYEASLGSANGNGGFLGSGRALDMFKNTAKGFNIRFPEIWQDSSHTRSYSIDMHFITPYATPYCKWRYVLVPFFHAFALAAPQAPKEMSVYGRPFLIKAFSKGYFNVECGIIESFSWKRFGDGDMISADGVPLQIDVTIDFKDLYHVLTMGNNQGLDNIGAFFNNTGLMDMLGTLSGVNMNRIQLSERISLFAGAEKDRIFGIGSNFMRHISDRTRNIAEKYFYGT